MLGGLLGVRPGDRLLRVRGESLDSIPDAWRLLCHTYGRVEILLERDARERSPPAYGSLFLQTLC